MSGGDAKTLDQITHAARVGAKLTVDELRFAVCAYDVLLAQLDVSRYPVQLSAYFQAAETPPEKYIGHANHPDDPGFQEWYRAFKSLGTKRSKTHET